MLLGACPDADPVDFAKTLDAAGKKVGVNFVGGYTALVHKGFSAGSYANMTRIATQNAADWSALYAGNRDALVEVLDAFAARFRDLRDAIARDDRAAVMRFIEEGTAAKRQELLDRRRGDEAQDLV